MPITEVPLSAASECHMMWHRSKILSYNIFGIWFFWLKCLVYPRIILRKNSLDDEWRIWRPDPSTRRWCRFTPIETVKEIFVERIENSTKYRAKNISMGAEWTLLKILCGSIYTDDLNRRLQSLPLPLIEHEYNRDSPGSVQLDRPRRAQECFATSSTNESTNEDSHKSFEAQTSLEFAASTNSIYAEPGSATADAGTVENFGGKSTRARKRARRKLKLKNSAAANATAGFIPQSKTWARCKGYFLPVESPEYRSCGADALYTAVHISNPSSLKSYPLSSVRKMIKNKVDDDSRDCSEQDLMDLGDRFFGIRLVCIREFGQSPKSLFSQEAGVYICRVLWYSNKNNSGYHFFCYDANSKLLIDNAPRISVPMIGMEEQKSNQKAILAFLHYFPDGYRANLLSVLAVTKK